MSASELELTLVELVDLHSKRKLPKELNGPQQLDLAAVLAGAVGMKRAESMIARLREEKYPIRDWELGACIWCEVDDGKRRKATQHDPGGGPPTCDRHALGPDEDLCSRRSCPIGVPKGVKLCEDCDPTVAPVD
ncbi:MAG TPA: hypothetical protein VI039_13185 [Solirubrobacterales bacterium]